MDHGHVVKEISIKDIFIGDNSRLEIQKEDLSDLMDSIKQQGLLQAIGVVPLKTHKNGKKYKIIYGNRRLTAFRKLRKKFIPARIIEDTEDVGEQIILNLVENDQRRDIDAFEFGRYCAYLNESLDYTMKEIAVALSCPVSRVKASIDIYKQIPHEYAGQIKTMPFGITRVKGEIPSSMAKTVVQMKRKYSLKKHQIHELLDLAAKDVNITQRSLNNVMYFMSQGLSMSAAIKKVSNVLIKRYEFSIDKKEADRLIAQYGNLNNAIHEIVYKSGEIKDPRPQLEVK